MRKLAPTRVRSGAYGLWKGRQFRDYVGVCRLCEDSCSFAGDDPKQDWLDALAWCYGHLAVFHPNWLRERCAHPFKTWRTNNTWTCILCKAKGGTR